MHKKFPDIHGYKGMREEEVLKCLPPWKRAQREYMKDLYVKYRCSLSYIGEKSGLNPSAINHFATLRNGLSPERAITIEHALGEKTIRYWRYLKKYWQPF